MLCYGPAYVGDEVKSQCYDSDSCAVETI